MSWPNDLVELHRDSAEEGFGFAYSPLDGDHVALGVLEFRLDGVVSKWNSACILEGKPEMAIRLGDRIVSVNGRHDLEGMRQALRDESSIGLVVERWPSTIVVQLEKRGPEDHFGLQTEVALKDDGSKVIQVLGIKEGLLSAWNGRASAAGSHHEVVEVGSEIVSVSCLAEPAQMQAALLNDAVVELVFKRPSASHADGGE